MSDDLKTFFFRTEEVKGKNFTINDVYDILDDCICEYTPTYLKLKYLELKKELKQTYPL